MLVHDVASLFEHFSDTADVKSVGDANKKHSQEYHNKLHVAFSFNFRERLMKTFGRGIKIQNFQGINRTQSTANTFGLWKTDNNKNLPEPSHKNWSKKQIKLNKLFQVLTSFVWIKCREILKQRNLMIWRGSKLIETENVFLEMRNFIVHKSSKFLVSQESKERRQRKNQISIEKLELFFIYFKERFPSNW